VVFVFPQTLSFSEGAGGARLVSYMDTGLDAALSDSLDGMEY